MLVVKLEVAIFREYRLLELLQAYLPALLDHRVEHVVLLVATSKELVALTVVDVQKIVRVLSGILDQLLGEWPKPY